MKTAIVNASDLGSRWDAGFHVTLAEYRLLVSELMQVSAYELVALAQNLPFSRQAADIVKPEALSISETKFRDWIDRLVYERQTICHPADMTEEEFASYEETGIYPVRRAPRTSVKRSKKRDIALYVAVAAQNAAGSVLEECLALQRQRLEKIKQLKSLTEQARQLSPMLHDVILGKTKDATAIP